VSKFHLHIVTPKGTYRDVDVDILNIRTTDGQMGILAHHMPLASGVEIAEMNYEFAVGGGFVYVDGDNTVTLIVNDIESPEEIDLRRAEEAKARAEERLRSKNPDVDLQRAEIALKKAITRIQVKNNY
jgi:F-type H+-transporting ATPase subunit epsilon